MSVQGGGRRNNGFIATDDNAVMTKNNRSRIGIYYSAIPKEADMIPFYLAGDEELHGDFPFSLKIHRLKDAVPPHGHNFLEYTYVFDGYGTETVNGIPHEMKPGIFTLLLPHQIHEIQVAPGNTLSLYVGGIGLKSLFGMDDSVLALNELILNDEYDLHPFYEMEGDMEKNISGLLQEMHAEIQGKNPWNRLFFKAKLVELFIRYDRQRMDLRQHKQVTGAPHKNSRVWNIIQYVYRNYREDISLKSLSERFFLSIPHISAAFKQCLGENFHSFLDNIRIAHACSLLITSELSVTDIAFEVGFKSYPTFSRVFLEHLKMSPTQYRKDQRILFTR